MNNFEKIKQEFFKVFGVEPKWQYKVQQFCHFYLCDQKAILENAHLFKERKTCKVKEAKKAYPEITDHKLLEMICIIADGKDGNKNLNLYTANEDEWFAVLKDQNNLAYCAAIDKSFKNAILKLCIYRADINDFKYQIQQLFKEGE